MFAICTAGHINHGKTTLVKQLTIKKQHGEININIIRDELRLSRKYCLSILDKMEEEKLITRNLN